MEYGIPLNVQIENRKTDNDKFSRDNSNFQNVLWSPEGKCHEELFSPKTAKMISDKVTQLLMGVDPENRPIVVPHKTIYSVLNNIFENYTPKVGDIYSRFIVTGENNRNDVRDIIDQTINVITSTIRNEFEMRQNNEKLTVWNTLYGEGVNEVGLRQHPPIKLRRKKRIPMQFNMNY